MGTVISTTTSFGGIDAETGESFNMGEGQVEFKHSAGKTITEETFSEYYSEQQAPGTVTRNGSSVSVNSFNDLRDDDLVNIGDGDSMMQVTVQTVKDMGMGYLLEEFIYGEHGQDDVNQFLQERGATEPESIDDIYRENLQDAVQAGEMSERLAVNAELLADRAAMAGYGAQDALDAAAHAIDTGDFSAIQEAGFSEQEAQAVVGELYNSLVGEAESVIGQVGVAELVTIGNRYPEAREMMLRTGMGMLQGTHGKQAFKSLHKILMNEYGGRG